MDSLRRNPARYTLPPRFPIRVRHRDLKTVGCKPSRVIEVLIAIAATPARTLHHHGSGLEIAHYRIRSRILRSRVLADVCEITAVGRDQQVFIGRPDIRGNRSCFNSVLSESLAKDLTLRSGRVL